MVGGCQSTSADGNGRLCIIAIAGASGVLRNAFYTNTKLKALIAAFQPSSFRAEEVQESGNVIAFDSRTRQPLALKEQLILDLEQQLTAAQDEVLDLRKLNSDHERRLVRNEIIEEDMLYQFSGLIQQRAGKPELPEQETKKPRCWINPENWYYSLAIG